MALLAFYAQGGAFSLPQPTAFPYSLQAPIFRPAPTPSPTTAYPKRKPPGSPGGGPFSGLPLPAREEGGRARAGRWGPGATSSTNPPPPGGSPLAA